MHGHFGARANSKRSTIVQMVVQGFSVFLCHNTAEKPAVEYIGRRLREKDEEIMPFLDTQDILPGRPWVSALEDAINQCTAVAVFVGPNGFGGWQMAEIRLAVDLANSKKDFHLIPVLLPGATKPAEHSFLMNWEWVQFQSLEDEEAWLRLISGIRGERKRPSPDSKQD